MAYFYTPFRKGYGQKESGAVGQCPFCVDENIQRQIVRDAYGRSIENDHYVWIMNWYPRYEGHTMVVPKKHVCSFEDETLEEAGSRHQLVTYASSIISQLYEDRGFEVFLQTGSGSESSVKHFHWHVVPTSPEDPFRGMEKIGLFTTEHPTQEKIILQPSPIHFAKESLLAELAPLVTKRPPTW